MDRSQTHVQPSGLPGNILQKQNDAFLVDKLTATSGDWAAGLDLRRPVMKIGYLRGKVENFSFRPDNAYLERIQRSYLHGVGDLIEKRRQCGQKHERHDQSFPHAQPLPVTQ